MRACIVFNNVEAKLDGLSISGYRELDSLMAVFVPGFQFTPAFKKGVWDGKQHFFNRATKKFPTGLMCEVEEYLRSKGHSFEVIDDRPVRFEINLPDNFTLNLGKDIKERDYQIEAVKKGVKFGRGVFNIATNGGKTEIACGIIKEVLPYLQEDELFLFFTHRQELFEQTRKRLAKRLNMKIGVFCSSEVDLRQVTVVMLPTMYTWVEAAKKKERSHKGEKIPLSKEKIEENKKKRDMVKWVLDHCVGFIVDECHHSHSSQFYDILKSTHNAFWRFGLTGTINENSINTKKLFAITGQILTKVSNEYLIKEGYSAKPHIYLIPITQPDFFGKSYREALVAGVEKNDYRNTVISTYVLSEYNKGSNILIIVNHKSHGNELVKVLKDLGLDPEFTHSGRTMEYRNNLIEMMKKGKARVVIATPLFDEGLDVDEINALFLVAAGKSFIQLLQRIGRGLRKKRGSENVLRVYDCMDLTNEYLVKHTIIRYDYYKAEGFEVDKLEGAVDGDSKGAN